MFNSRMHSTLALDDARGIEPVVYQQESVSVRRVLGGEEIHHAQYIYKLATHHST